MSEERQRESQRSKEEAGEEREEGSEGGTEKKPEKVARNNNGGLIKQLPILFWGVPYYNYSINGPRNSILIMRAPYVNKPYYNYSIMGPETLF